MAVQTAPCTWPIDYTTCSCEALSGNAASGTFEQMAREYLWNWTGRRFGICELILRPCRQDCLDGISTFWGRGPFPGSASPWTPVLIDGLWFNLQCGRCRRDQCGCGTMHSIKLPGPVASVSQIIIDGELLDPLAYRMDNGDTLVRIDGHPWPECQDLTSPSASGFGAPNTWQITYQRGVDVPFGGRVAAALLACEFAKAACNDGSCQLPTRLQSLTRQGVSIAILDTFDDIDKGHTGIWAIDSWVASVMKGPTPSKVMSVDLKRKGSRTTFGPGGQPLSGGDTGGFGY